MSKSFQLSILILFSIFVLSCKNDKTESKVAKSTPTVTTTNEASPLTGKTFSLVENSAKVNWVAYKTTAKLPVSGSFKEVTIENIHEGKNITAAIDGLKFSIPINSVFTENEARDIIIAKSFFGSMRNTTNITGSIVAKSLNNAYANITMNGLTARLPIKYRNNGTNIKMTAKMYLNTWKTKAAIDALNLVCNEKHKGKDGISKTWNEVAIEITGKLKIEDKK